MPECGCGRKYESLDHRRCWKCRCDGRRVGPHKRQCVCGALTTSSKAMFCEACRLKRRQELAEQMRGEVALAGGQAVRHRDDWPVDILEAKLATLHLRFRPARRFFVDRPQPAV